MSEGSLWPAGTRLRRFAFILSAAAAIRGFPAGADMIRAKSVVGHSVDQCKAQRDAGNAWQDAP